MMNYGEIKDEKQKRQLLNEEELENFGVGGNIMKIELSLINEVINEQISNAVDNRRDNEDKAMDALLLIETMVDELYKKCVDADLKGRDIDSLKTLGKKAKSFRDVIPYM